MLPYELLKRDFVRWFVAAMEEQHCFVCGSIVGRNVYVDDNYHRCSVCGRRNDEVDRSFSGKTLASRATQKDAWLKRRFRRRVLVRRLWRY